MGRKIGHAFAKATCKNCGREIECIWYGDGGTRWQHDDGYGTCSAPVYADPDPDTVTDL